VKRLGDNRTVTADTCTSCGRLLDLHDRHVRFTLPDPVVDAGDSQLAPDAWMSHATARESVMMQVPPSVPSSARCCRSN